jgi:hypothetical protein
MNLPLFAAMTAEMLPPLAAICHRQLPEFVAICRSDRCSFIAIKPSPTPYRWMALVDYPVR